MKIGNQCNLIWMLTVVLFASTAGAFAQSPRVDATGSVPTVDDLIDSPTGQYEFQVVGAPASTAALSNARLIR